MKRMRIEEEIPNSFDPHVTNEPINDFIDALMKIACTKDYSDVKISLDAGYNNISARIVGTRLENDSEFAARQVVNKKIEEAAARKLEERKKKLIEEAESLGLKLIE